MSSTAPIYAIIFFLLVLLLPPESARSTQGEADPLFEDLVNRLSADGFDKTILAGLYQKERVRFATDTVSLFFVHSEAKLNYDQFTAPGAIQRAREYMKVQASPLSAAWRAYGTDPEVVTAIILVETRLGSYTGNSSVLDALSTMAALTDDWQRNYLWERIPQERKVSRTEYEKKAAQKSRWAYGELKAFLAYTLKEGIAPDTVRGSYAGAMGISQFMPSNILKLARDGNHDGRIDLFDHSDAIMSTANYLHHHGWHTGIDREAAYKVILRYNYSRYYARTILAISDLLKGKS